MKQNFWWGPVLAGICAGAVSGLLGAGGGMILIPMLIRFSILEERECFTSSVSIMLPICLVSLAASAMDHPLPWANALPYLVGSAAGGVLSGLWGHKIPTSLLHKFFGILILWGGIRNLW